MEHLTVNFDGSQLRTEYLGGEEYYVVPMVMMTEGVHNGSQGPLYYEKDELDRWSPSWNHKPIVINHPNKGSACSQKYLNQSSVGLVLNTRWDRGKQRAEAWLNKKRLATVAPKILKAVENQKVSEVSTGLFVDPEGDPGFFKGVKYEAIARNHKPDHLAILTDSEGACSVRKGAGLFQQNRKGKKIKSKHSKKRLHKNSSSKEDSLSVKHRRSKMKKREFIDKLIANKQTRFTKQDRTFLESLDAEQLKKLVPAEAKETKNALSMKTQEELDAAIEEGIQNGLAKDLKDPKKLAKLKKLIANAEPDEDEDEDEEDDEEVVENASGDEPDMDDEDEAAAMKRMQKKKKKQMANNQKTPDLKTFLEKHCPAELRPVLNKAVAFAQGEHERLVEVCMANADCPFKKEQLLKMDPEYVRGLAALCKGTKEEEVQNTSYFGSAIPSGPTLNKKKAPEGKEALGLPVYNFEDYADAS